MTTDNVSTEPAAAATSVAGEVRSAAKRNRLLRILQGQGLLVVLAALVVFFAVKSPAFLEVGNFLAIGAVSGVLGVMAITQTFLIISGGIDISIGSAAAVSGVILGRAYEADVNIWAAVVIALLVGGAIGALNGLITVRLKINPLVTTLGTYSVFLGLSYVISNATTLVISDKAFSFLGSGKILGIPVPLIIFVVALLIGLLVERRTATGRAIFAIGGNLEAARLSGIRINLIRFLLYLLSGLSAGVAGIVLTAQLSTSSPNIGSAYLLSVVTAVILGGTSLQGGRGSLAGTLVAVVILGVLQNGFALLSVSSFAQTMVLGIFLIGAVLLDQTVRGLRR